MVLLRSPKSNRNGLLGIIGAWMMPASVSFRSFVLRTFFFGWLLTRVATFYAGDEVALSISAGADFGRFLLTAYYSSRTVFYPGGRNTNFMPRTFSDSKAVHT